MNERPFLDASNKPADLNLPSVLGSMFVFYREVLGLADSYTQEWIYSKSGGWMLKVFDRKKALFYLIPLNECFKINMAIRQEEREAFMNDNELGDLHQKLTSAKKYSEGFAMQFDITNQKDHRMVELFIKKLIAIRK
jgi:hypothetical protein